MNVLAFDTCFGAVSVAVRLQLAAGEWVLRKLSEKRKSGHAERLMPMISEVLAAASLNLGDIDRFAVTVGPGTFTGVRVGVAAARALALAAGKPVVGMTSLALIAHGAAQMLGDARRGRTLLVAVDARQDMVYGQLFNADAAALTEPQLLPTTALAASIAARAVLVVGNGASAVAAAIAAAGGSAEPLLLCDDPNAAVLARMAPDLDPISPVRPFYLRAPDAKPQGDNPLLRAVS
jgi:tRNA threonylcarbamoyladenosine biosynthesis protein TsaB